MPYNLLGNVSKYFIYINIIHLSSSKPYKMYYHSPFTDEESEVQRLCHLPKVTEPKDLTPAVLAPELNLILSSGNTHILPPLARTCPSPAQKLKTWFFCISHNAQFTRGLHFYYCSKGDLKMRDSRRPGQPFETCLCHMELKARRVTQHFFQAGTVHSIKYNIKAGRRGGRARRNSQPCRLPAWLPWKALVISSS